MTEVKRAHSTLGPSKSKRWMSCPGSIRLEQQCPPQKASKYAAEGTAAHSLGEMCLKMEMNAADFIGEVLKADGFDFTVTEEMAEAVQVYVDHIRALASDEDLKLGKKLVFVEQRFDLSWLWPGIFGSNDSAVYDVENKKLYIRDYKHGQGVVVEPEWNSQLLMYALGAMHALWLTQSEKTRAKFSALDLVKHVDLGIVQPRAQGEEPVKSWEVRADDVWFWGVNVLAPAAAATERENARLSVGDHCRFCPALAVCPEQVKNAMVVAQTDFETLTLPDPASLSVTDIVKVMQASDIIATWAKEVAAFAKTRAEAGVEIPGYKLVRGRANRKWKDEAQAACTLEMMLGKEAYDNSVISIAVAEKKLKGLGQNPDAVLAGLWEKPEGAISLVHESDKRPAVAPTAAVDFIESADFLS